MTQPTKTYPVRERRPNGTFTGRITRQPVEALCEHVDRQSVAAPRRAEVCIDCGIFDIAVGA